MWFDVMCHHVSKIENVIASLKNIILNMIDDRDEMIHIMNHCFTGSV